MASYYGKHFDKTFKQLVKEMGCKFPIKLRTVTAKEIKKICLKLCGDSEPLYALCEIESNQKGNIKNATIYIVRGLSLSFAEFQLIHELAHIIQKGGDKSPHGYKWGEAYAKMYNIYIGADIRRNKEK